MREDTSIEGALRCGLGSPFGCTAMIVGPPGSGKSLEIERALVKSGRNVVYLATLPNGPEFASVIEAHRSRRPRVWPTIELGGRAVSPLARAAIASRVGPAGVILLEGLYLHSLFVAASELWTDDDEEARRLAIEIADSVCSLARLAALLVVVSGAVVARSPTWQQSMFHAVAKQVDSAVWSAADVRLSLRSEAARQE